MIFLIGKCFQLTKSFSDNQMNESLENTFLESNFTKTNAP